MTNPLDVRDTRALAGVGLMLALGLVVVVIIAAIGGLAVRVFMLTSGLGGGY